MKDAPRQPSIARESFSFRDRDFLRVTLPDDETPGAVFSVAETSPGATGSRTCSRSAGRACCSGRATSGCAGVS